MTGVRTQLDLCFRIQYSTLDSRRRMTKTSNEHLFTHFLISFPSPSSSFPSPSSSFHRHFSSRRKRMILNSSRNHSSTEWKKIISFTAALKVLKIYSSCASCEKFSSFKECVTKVRTINTKFVSLFLLSHSPSFPPLSHSIPLYF